VRCAVATFKAVSDLQASGVCGVSYLGLRSSDSRHPRLSNYGPSALRPDCFGGLKARIVIARGEAPGNLSPYSPPPCKGGTDQKKTCSRIFSVRVWRNGRAQPRWGLTGSRAFSQGSLAHSATLALGAQSLWDWADKSAQEEHSIWFMAREQVRMEQGTFH
jgi:hypothetical protein